MAEEKSLLKAKRITWIGFWINIFLALIKLLAGFIGKSRAVIADATHSITDIFTDFVVLMGIKVGRRPADDTHHYGHGKFETLSATILGVVLFGAGFGILLSGLNLVIKCLHGEILNKPGWIAFYAAIGSIVIKEILFQYTIKIGKEINSQSIIANAWHHRSDALSSMGTTLGVLGSIILGQQWRILDPFAAVIVSIFIIKIGISILIDSLEELLEKSLDKNTETKILNIIKATEGVKNPHNLKTRKIGSNIAIDVHIEVHEHSTIVQAHNVSTEVEKNLRKELGENTFVSVHIEPSSGKEKPET